MTTKSENLTTKPEDSTIPTTKSSEPAESGRKPRKPRKSRRESRISLTEQRRMTGIEENPEFVRRWVTDKDDRLVKFQKAGYEFIDKSGNEIERDNRIQDPSEIGSSALTQSIGGGQTAYAMQIPAEWYREDQNNKQRKISQAEKSTNDRFRDNPTMYGEGIKIDHQNLVKKSDVGTEVEKILREKQIIT